MELKANRFESNNLSFFFFVLEDVIQLIRKNLNGYIALKEPGRKPVQLADMLQFFSLCCLIV